MPKETTLPVRKNGEVLYNICLETSFLPIIESLKNFHLNNRRVCIVTDSNVGPLYLDEFINTITPVVGYVTSFTFPAGEQQKNLDTVKALYEHLILERFDRNDMLIALGGGVVGDLTGFAAATYLRGIDFIQVPTTLLACVDSSIGGKTGVDFNAYKNMVGAFHQPKLVYINLPVLHSLGKDEFACGMGEILKHGLIKDAKYYEWLIDHMSEIDDRDTEVIASMILKSCKIKRAVVEKDPTEKGERALLNFGHTIGHAIEKLLNGTMLHGQCVALGSVAAAYISYKRNYLSTEEFFEIRDMNVGFNLPISIDGLLVEEVLDATKSDKKMDAGQIKFVLLKSLGDAIVDTTVTDQELSEAISFLIEGAKEEE